MPASRPLLLVATLLAAADAFAPASRVATANSVTQLRRGAAVTPVLPGSMNVVPHADARAAVVMLDNPFAPKKPPPPPPFTPIELTVWGFVFVFFSLISLFLFVPPSYWNPWIFAPKIFAAFAK